LFFTTVSNHSSWLHPPYLGVANCPSKTMGLAVSFFSGYVHLAVSIFFCKDIRKSQSNNLFLFFYRWCLNVLEPEHLELVFKMPLGLTYEEVKMSWARKESLAYSQSLAIPIHHPYYLEKDHAQPYSNGVHKEKLLHKIRYKSRLVGWLVGWLIDWLIDWLVILI